MMHVSGRVLLGTLMILSLALIGCANPNSGASVPSAVGRTAGVTTGYLAVGLLILPGGSAICSGTVIAENAVLTAAHCTQTVGRYTFVLGTRRFSSYTVFNTGCFGVECNNDLGIVKFDEKIAVRGKDPIYKLSNRVKSGDRMRLVGFGCKSVKTKRGSGEKRAGTNDVEVDSNYLVFRTPVSSVDDRAAVSRNIIGDEAQAGSCFGDSGGPTVHEPEGGATGNELELEIAGVTHAGGKSGDFYFSEYVNVATDSDNREWIRSIASQEGLSIVGL